MTRRAILAVYDKTGIVEFARGLHDMGWELVGTGGTAKAIADAGLPITQVADLTGSPEMLGGRVKTLHPKVHGGLLYRRGLAEDEADVQRYDIPNIDLMAGNLYPFVETVTKGSPTLAQALEEIDIGGPTMIRASAKNHPWVIPLIDPSDYTSILVALRAAGGDPVGVAANTRRRLAAKAFQHVAHYDTAIAEYLRDEADLFPEQLTFGMTRREVLRYGENPHQQGAFYTWDSVRTPVEGIGGLTQHHGKALSYVNILDADAAFNSVAEFDLPAISIIKHTNPACFAAGDASVASLYERALTEGDFVSAYGGIVAVNRVVDMALAEALREVRSPSDGDTRMFYEIVIAPGYEPDALDHLKKKSKDLRILEAPIGDARRERVEFKSVRGGVLVQNADVSFESEATFQVVSERQPTASEIADLRVAWNICKHVKSNGVVFVKDGVLVGMGAGQPNRVGSARLCKEQAGERARGAVCATDAFLPFPDTLEVAASAGCTLVAHTGGSIRDQDSVEAANREGVSLVVTGVRHFRH
ncbi:MAG: bifunctional phosphoribosylaminoimidazolecarboxamide formyltransferase/IMP cyclohydrolase [Dehalococcoidia bacterium]|nr:bifunctional phosphoribosylaminoimidazolecarboxamide formyltransferase/IMP cyclohydrolase [Dehalococcoidia bacterium]